MDFGGVVDCVRWEFEFVWWWECVVASAGCKFVRSACLSLSACPPASLAARCLAAFKSCSLSRPPSLPSLIHILCTRGCLILVDQTSNTRGHLRPPPSWWCVRPCAFVYSPTYSQCGSSVPISSFSVCEHSNGVPVRPSRPIPYPKRYPPSVHFMI